MFLAIKLVVCFCLLGVESLKHIESDKGSNNANHVFGILGGRASSIKKHPYQVSIFNRKMNYLCSGAIINKSWILTTATCLMQYKMRPTSIVIRTGSTDLSQGGQTYKAEKIFHHGSFEQATRNYDFALIRTTQSIKFNKETNMIDYATEPVTEGETGVASGWGIDKVKKDKRLYKELTVTALDFEDCKDSHPNIVGDTMLCVESSPKSFNGYCDYSSGDLIVSQKKVVGLFAAYPECVNTKHPAIFSDVAFAAPWIQDLIES